jgi:hypothetical protein
MQQIDKPSTLQAVAAEFEISADNSQKWIKPF